MLESTSSDKTVDTFQMTHLQMKVAFRLISKFTLIFLVKPILFTVYILYYIKTDVYYNQQFCLHNILLSTIMSS